MYANFECYVKTNDTSDRSLNDEIYVRQHWLVTRVCVCVCVCVCGAA